MSNEESGALKHTSKKLAHYTESTIDGTFKEFVIAHLNKYPNKELIMVENAFNFGFKMLNKDTLVYYKIKYPNAYFKLFSSNGLEKVVINLKDKIMKTVEVNLTKTFDFEQNFMIDRIFCVNEHFSKMKMHKYLYSDEEIGYFFRKKLEYGRTAGDKFMNSFMLEFRENFEFNLKY